MAMMNMSTIMDSDTCSTEAKLLANQIYIKTKALSVLLCHRVDPKAKP